MNFVIVEDTYLNVKYQNSYSWLFGDDHDHEEGQVHGAESIHSDWDQNHNHTAIE